MPATEMTEASLDQALTRSAWVLVNFCGGWSGPCRRFASLFDADAEQHPDIVFARVDTGREQRLETRFDITVVPTVIAFRDGHAVFRYAGSMSHAELEWSITKLYALHRGGPTAPPVPPG